MQNPTILGMKLMVFALVLGANLRADVDLSGPYSYVWQGNGLSFCQGTHGCVSEASGMFTLDGSSFNDTSVDFVSEFKLTAFSFEVGGVAFDISDIAPAASIFGTPNIVFNSTVNPPQYLDGAGIAALDSAGDWLSFNPGFLVVVYKTPPGSGQSVFSSGGTFIPTPEPGASILLLTMLVGVAAAFRHRLPLVTIASANTPDYNQVSCLTRLLFMPDGQAATANSTRTRRCLNAAPPTA